MTILFAYDGSESADAAIAAAGKLLDHDHADAVVLTVWEPRLVRRGLIFRGSGHFVCLSKRGCSS